MTERRVGTSQGEAQRRAVLLEDEMTRVSPILAIALLTACQPKIASCPFAKIIEGSIARRREPAQLQHRAQPTATLAANAR